MKQAQNYNWIGSNDDTLFIRSWQYLFDTLHFHKKACFRFRKSDLKKFKTYCYAGVISYMARTQIRELERLRAQPRTKGRSNQTPVWVPMASLAIAKTLKVPEPTARKYRNLAVKAGYFKKRPDIRPFEINLQDLRHFRNFDEQQAKSLIVENGKVCKQYPDKVRIDLKRVHSPKRFFVQKKNLQGVPYSMPYKMSREL